MKKLTLAIAFLSFFIIGEAQTFQFKISFEDASGNKDTLTIGYDQNGTESIDPSFGETNSIGSPLRRGW